MIYINIKYTLFEFLRAGICGKELEPSTRKNISEENLTELYNLANKHDVAQIVADVLFKNNLLVGSKLESTYRNCLMTSVFRYQQLSYELERICELFEKNEIPYMPLKGSVIRDKYPDPWFRTSCDIDILVHECDLHKAGGLLVEELNYTTAAKGNHDISFWTEIGVHIELHYDLISHDIKKNGGYHRKWNAHCLSDVWEHAVIPDGKKYYHCMRDEMFYFYHIAHMAKHFESGGCGIRPFLDLWLLNSNMDYDEERRNRLLEDGKLIAFERAVKKLSDIWLSNAEYGHLSVLIENYIVESGVYGNMKNLIAFNRGKLGSSFRYTLSRIFVSEDVLRIYYPALADHKWLLPFCQIGRWFKIVYKGRMKSSISELKYNSTLTNAAVEHTAFMIHELEL